MSSGWKGNNPYAALSKPTTSRDNQPKPRKNLAKAKDASKINKKTEEPAPQKVAQVEGRKGGRPATQVDRKGRDKDRKSGMGPRRGDAKKNGGKGGWGSDEQAIRDADGEYSPKEKKSEKAREAREAEEEAKRKEEERILEESQFTLKDFKSQKAEGNFDNKVEFQSARKVDTDVSKFKVLEKKPSKPVQVKQKNGQKKEKSKKAAKKVLEIGAPKQKRRDNNNGGRNNNRDGGRRDNNNRNGGNKGGDRRNNGNNNGRRNNQGGNTNNNNNNKSAPKAKSTNNAKVFEDAESFPTLGGK